MMKKIFIFFIFIFISILFILFNELYLFSLYDSSIKEVIIPEIKIKNGGVAGVLDPSMPKYINDDESITGSDIKLKSYIKLKQRVNRYMKVSGFVDKKKSAFIKKIYRSVIFEIRNINTSKSNFFMIPLDDKNRFTGYIYFLNKGAYAVYAYIFYDYYSYKGNDERLKSNNSTMASVVFYAESGESIPEKHVHLIPTKNIDCGNKLLRDYTCRITRGCDTNLEKVKKIYEFIVFGEGSIYKKIKFKKYDKNIKEYSKDYHNIYTASQILTRRNGICNDFAEVFAAMVRSRGIKVKKIWGFTDETRTIGHMWNLVDLTGDETVWLKIDPSWGNINKSNHKKWAEIYPEFDEYFFENTFSPYNHKSFNYELKIEY